MRRLIVVAGLCWLDPRRILVQRRAAGAAHGAGMLEFPGGKVEPGEAPTAALARELVEEWGAGAAAVRIGEIAEVLHHDYPPPGPEVILLLYHVDGRALGAAGAWRARIRPTGGEEIEEIELERLADADFLAADRPLVARLRAGVLGLPEGLSRPGSP